MNSPLTDFSTSPIVHGSPTGWRMRVKLAVRPGPKIGLFKPGTHEVEDLIDCPDHHPAINQALHVLRSHSFIPYNEADQSGDLRYIQLTLERMSGQVQLVLVSNGPDRCFSLADALASSFPWHSIWINIQEGATNTIFGPKWIHHSGKQTVQDFNVYFHPACFIQANLELFETILADIETLLIPNKKVLELYAGVGVISLHCAHKIKEGTLVEINPFAERCFRQSDPPSHLDFRTGPSQQFLDLMEEVLIVDPPRKGLDPEILDAITESSLEQILYLSCNEETLRRDVEALIQKGWSVGTIKRYALFPGTPHIETLVSIQKNPKF